MTPLRFIKWVLLWLPLIVVIPGTIGSQQYELVLREDTIAPVMGVPRSLFFLSLLGTLAYAVMACTICRDQISTMFRSRIPQASGLPLLAFILTPVSIWAVGEALKILLDFSAPRQYQATIQSLHYVRSTPYAKANDWRDPQGYVLFRGGRSFLQQYPVGSTVNVTTRQGFFGYEYMTGIGLSAESGTMSMSAR